MQHQTSTVAPANDRNISIDEQVQRGSDYVTKELINCVRKDNDVANQKNKNAHLATLISVLGLLKRCEESFEDVMDDVRLREAIPRCPTGDLKTPSNGLNSHQKSVKYYQNCMCKLQRTLVH